MSKVGLGERCYERIAQTERNTRIGEARRRCGSQPLVGISEKRRSFGVPGAVSVSFLVIHIFESPGGSTINCQPTV